MDENPHCTGVDIGSEIIKNADTNLLNTDLDYNLINNDFFIIKDDFKDKFDLYSVNHLLSSYKSQKMLQDLVC